MSTWTILTGSNLWLSQPGPCKGAMTVIHTCSQLLYHLTWFVGPLVALLVTDEAINVVHFPAKRPHYFFDSHPTYTTYTENTYHQIFEVASSRIYYVGLVTSAFALLAYLLLPSHLHFASLSPSNPPAALMTQHEPGYKAVAYFVNWLVHIPLKKDRPKKSLRIPPMLRFRQKGNLRPQPSSARYSSRQTHPHPLRLCKCPARKRRGLSNRSMVRY